MSGKGYPAQVAAGGALSRDAGAALGVFVLILNIVAGPFFQSHSVASGRLAFSWDGSKTAICSGARTVFADGGGHPAQTRPKPTQWKRREPSVSFPAG